MYNPFLDPHYTHENQLQAINATAAQIERETGIAVMRCHLGNPMAPGFRKSDLAAAKFFKARHKSPQSLGYADVVGHADIRNKIADALTKINRLPEGAINRDNIRGVNGGTGALNVALAVFKNPTVLVSEPYYPPVMEIAHHVGRRMETFKLRREDDFLLNHELIEKRIQEINAEHPDGPIVLIYHYPHNPTGKTLSEEEAKKVADCLNTLCRDHPNLHLVQEDLYLATTAPEKGIYTPLAYLEEPAKSRVMWLHSPSKMGHAQDRGAIIAAFDKDLLHHIRGVISFDTLGPSHPSMLLTANTLAEIADGGVDAITDKGARKGNYRYKTAKFYQDRLKIVANGIADIEQKLGTSILPGGRPEGTYYLFPSFDVIRGKKIPEALASVFHGKETFENADDFALALQNAHLLGLQPVTVGSGTLFTRDPKTMHVRISTIEPVKGKMNAVVNTLKGLAEKTLGVDLGAKFYSEKELKSKFPIAGKSHASQTQKMAAGGRSR